MNEAELIPPLDNSNNFQFLSDKDVSGPSYGDDDGSSAILADATYESLITDNSLIINEPQKTPEEEEDPKFRDTFVSLDQDETANGNMLVTSI